jgi:hypothetical protein
MHYSVAHRPTAENKDKYAITRYSRPPRLGDEPLTQDVLPNLSLDLSFEDATTIAIALNDAFTKGQLSQAWADMHQAEPTETQAQERP